MSRPTKQSPERGNARTRLLEAARDIIREKGFAATSVDDLCRAADVTKGAFFHHFASKDVLGVAAADFWAETTSAYFAAAPYHRPSDPLSRVLAYVAFRKTIIAGELKDFTCLVGTMAQEVFASAPDIREACGRSMFGHTATLEADIEMARQERGITTAGWTAESLARHTQAVLQGGFVLAKAANDPALARESLDHLERYIRQLFNVTEDDAHEQDNPHQLRLRADTP
jgi:TetR/AcrR family transcriptional regulator, transcriptional repressor for nem operon